jgi:hypothetical protein
MCTEALALKNEKTHHHHPGPAGSSQGGEHVGREVRPKPRVSQVGLCQGRDAGISRGRAGGAALAYAIGDADVLRWSRDGRSS